jgi:uncharacterized membrane protein YccC
MNLASMTRKIVSTGTNTSVEEVSPSSAPAAKPSAWPAFWQSVVRFQSAKVTPWVALRNSIGLAIPLVAGVVSGQVTGGLAMATGALNVSYSDSYDPYVLRARKMLSASICVALALFAGALSGHSIGTAVAMAAIWSFAAGMMVGLSQAAADVGTISLVTLLVYAAVPQTLERAVYGGLLAFAGGLLQTALSLGFWPLRRYLHQRLALGDLFLELARSSTTTTLATQPPPASAQTIQAQNVLAALNNDHSIAGERYRVLLSQAERMRLSLVMLGRMRTRMEREQPGSDEAATLQAFFETCAGVLRSIGESLRAGVPSSVVPEQLRKMEDLAEELREEDETAPQALAFRKDARFQMDALAGQLRSAVDLATSSTPAGLQAFERREARRPWTMRLTSAMATLIANLSLRSTACRHAIRLSVCVALGDAVARGFGLHRSYWLPMTIAIVLKPDFTATFSRGVLRLGGTFAGLLFATGLFHVLPVGLHGEVALIVTLMFVLRWVGSANYGIFVTTVTALVVLLIAMSGVSPKEVIAARAWNTIAGGAIALLAYWLWPTWERTRVSEALAAMLDGYRKYFRAVRGSYTNPGSVSAADLDRARLTGRLARSNLQASIDRSVAEPGTSADAIGLMGAMLASSHRLAHALMALEAGLASTQPVAPREAFHRYANDFEFTMYHLAAALRGSPLSREELPDLREDHHALIQSGDSLQERYALVNIETDRITNSMNTLSEDILRWISGKPG